MTERDNRALIERYYALVDRGDLDQMLELFTDDCVYERPGTEPLRGREELEAFYRNQRAIDSGAHTLTSVLTVGSAAVVEGRFKGRLRDGRDVSVRFADIFELQDGGITGRRSYFFVPAV